MRGIFKSRWLQIGLVLCLLGGAAGIWALLHPAAFWLQPWRPERSVVSSRYIFGPYPIEPDFIALKEQGVTTIISLLDPMLPYEQVLLGQEQVLAQKYGMRVLNFPMASILGQSFGKDYLANSKAAAQAALGSPGVVYLHCYLGLHRAANVRKFIEAASATGTASYEGTIKSERSADTLALERAGMAFREGRMDETLRELATIQVKIPEAVLVEGWTNYRLRRFDQARAAFTQVLAERPDIHDAAVGLGYCAMQTGDLAEAERQFSLVLSKHPDNASAIEGLGHVRYRQGRLAEARTHFERILARNPDHAEIRAIMAKLKAADRHVVVVIVDGLRPDALGVAPQMLELAAAGASTRIARAVGIPATVPSFVTMLTGLSPQRHGMQKDSDRIESLAVPTLFTRVHDSGGRSALYFGKPKLAALAAPGTAEVRHGPSPDGADWAAGSSATLAGQFASEFKAQPFAFALVHLREADFVGHQKGWMSADYLAAVRQVDQAVGTIRKAIAESSALASTTLILTSDHGGDGTRHGTASEVAFTIPWICQGPWARRGTIDTSITLLDLAPTVLKLLSLPPLPQAEGKPVSECGTG